VVKAAAIRERQASSFSAVFQRHVEQDASRTISSWRNVDRVVRLHVLPTIGDMPLADVRRSEVHRILDNLVANERVGTAREVRKHLSRFFNWAVDRELLPSNPIHGLRRNDLLPQSEAGRALNEQELIAIWSAASELKYPFGWLFQILILTGQRRAEWAEAKRSELNVDCGVLELSRERFKGRRSHIVPLAPQASTLLHRLPVWAVADYFLFSSKAGRVPVSGFSQAKKRLDQLAQVKMREVAGDKTAVLSPYRVHDFRVTCETRLAQLGFDRDIRDAVLGHAKPGLQKTYNKYDYLEEKRGALTAYAAHVMGVVNVH
jgi:integrase